MNQNAYEVFIYMSIHFFIFTFKDIIWKILSKIFSIFHTNNEEKELESMINKLNSLNEELKNISQTQDFPKYTRKEREITELNEKIKNKKQIILEKELKIPFTAFFKYPFESKIYYIYFVEYLLLKNKYLEVDYQMNKNNIVVNHYYKETDNKYYALIPVYKILLWETLALHSIYHLIKKLF